MPAEFCRYCGAGVGAFRRIGEGTCQECDPQPNAPPAIVWEYTRHFIERDKEQSALAHYGSRGWELCAVDRIAKHADGDGKWALFYFKRPKAV